MAYIELGPNNLLNAYEFAEIYDIESEEATEAWEALAKYVMDPDIREQLHMELAPCSRLEFLKRYLEQIEEDIVPPARFPVYRELFIGNNLYKSVDSLKEAFKRYVKSREELGETVEPDDTIYLASGVDEETGKRYYAIHDNANCGSSCTPADLAKFDEWWDTSWDAKVC